MPNPNQEDSKKKPPSQHQVSDLILGGLKPRTSKDTSNWITGLADNVISDAVEAASQEQPAAPPPTLKKGKPVTVSFADQLFDHFQQYEFEFNRTVAGTDYVITIERPTFHREIVRGSFGAQETVRTFRGRLSTRFFSMILRATEFDMECWILPVEQTIGFRADDPLYRPYVSLAPVQGKTSWTVNGTVIEFSETRLLAKQLFAALIRHARGEALEGEQFSMGGQLPPKAASTPSPGACSPPLQSLPKTKQTLRSTSSRNKPAARDVADIDASVASLQAAIDRRLEILTTAGAEAFGKQDMAQVESLYKKASRVKELQGKLNQFMKQWKEAMDQVLNSQ
jgi:hypothetical protein